MHGIAEGGGEGEGEGGVAPRGLKEGEKRIGRGAAGIADIGRGARIVWPHLPVRAHPITHLMSGQRH